MTPVRLALLLAFAAVAARSGAVGPCSTSANNYTSASSRRSDAADRNDAARLPRVVRSPGGGGAAATTAGLGGATRATFAAATDTQRRKLIYSYAQSGRCNATRPTTFIVVSEQRSGSTWLKEMLNGHPCIFMYGELFMNAVRRKRFEDHLLHPQKYMGAGEHKPPVKHLSAVGLKAFYYTTAPPTVLSPRNAALHARVRDFMNAQRGVFLWLRREARNDDAACRIDRLRRAFGSIRLRDRLARPAHHDYPRADPRPTARRSARPPSL